MRSLTDLEQTRYSTVLLYGCDHLYVLFTLNKSHFMKASKQIL